MTLDEHLIAGLHLIEGEAKSPIHAETARRARVRLEELIESEDLSFKLGHDDAWFAVWDTLIKHNPDFTFTTGKDATGIEYAVNEIKRLQQYDQR